MLLANNKTTNRLSELSIFRSGYSRFSYALPRFSTYALSAHENVSFIIVIGIPRGIEIDHYWPGYDYLNFSFFGLVIEGFRTHYEHQVAVQVENAINRSQGMMATALGIKFKMA